MDGSKLIREYWYRNMDIIGVAEVSAEAELISAIVSFLESVGLGPKDITIKVSSRKVLQSVLEKNKVPAQSFGPVCVVVDKLDKMPAEKVSQIASTPPSQWQLIRVCYSACTCAS